MPAHAAESSDFGFAILDFRLFDHRITLSALAKTLGGIGNPICFAVFRLMMNSNFVGCSAAEFTGFLLGGLSTENAVDRPARQMD